MEARKEANLNLIIKCSERDEARRLRLEGMSLRDIGKKINLSVYTVRNMVKDITLSEEQKKELLSKRKGTIKKDIKIDYKTKNLKIKGKIKLQISKKQYSSFDEQKLIDSIIEICILQ
jgi:orotate phosphoribosyltransferase-like protein